MSKKREYPKRDTKFYYLETGNNGPFLWSDPACHTYFELCEAEWERTDYYEYVFRSGNFFLTKREALAAKRKLEAAIKEVDLSEIAFELRELETV